jgi:hypothetical protein
MREVAIVSFAQAPLDQPPGQTETMMLLPTITDALDAVGLTRADVGFTCSGSADYLTGGTFTFVQILEAAGAWPPIAESHVEMDGAGRFHPLFRAGRALLRQTLTPQHDPHRRSSLAAPSDGNLRARPAAPSRPRTVVAGAPRRTSRSPATRRRRPAAGCAIRGTTSAA